MKILMVFLYILLVIPCAFAQETIHLTNGEWSPYLSKDLKHYGVISRIVSEAFKLEGINVEYHFFPWKRAFVMAEKGKMDGSIIWGLRSDRAEKFYYSDSVLSAKYVFFHLKEYSFKWENLNDLKNVSIGVPLGYSFGDEFEAAKRNKELQVYETPNTHTNFQLLLAKRIQICPEEIEVGYNILRREFGKKAVELITHHPKLLLPGEKHYLIMTKTNSRNKRMIELFNKGLKKLREQGKIKQYFAESRRGDYIINR